MPWRRSPSSARGCDLPQRRTSPRRGRRGGPRCNCPRTCAGCPSSPSTSPRPPRSLCPPTCLCRPATCPASARPLRRPSCPRRRPSFSPSSPGGQEEPRRSSARSWASPGASPATKGQPPPSEVAAQVSCQRLWEPRAAACPLTLTRCRRPSRLCARRGSRTTRRPWIPRAPSWTGRRWRCRAAGRERPPPPRRSRRAAFGPLS
mmetsp:Transcript_112363/g.324578  ORF Transcript_112363/g.324578 Transcript_112363/m.324578 type:complete len:204 (+) Transcript_112363:414-1025(+)